MPGHILLFELKHHFRRVSTWTYFGVLLALAFVVTCAQGGAWPEFEMGHSTQRVNSPFAIVGTLSLFGLFMVPVTAALAGNAVYRDFETGIFPLVATTPVSRLRYLGGRYLAAVVANAVVVLAVPLGSALATAMPFLEPERVGPFHAGAYLVPLGVIALPNLVLTSALFFTLATLTRRMLPVYVAAVALLGAYGTLRGMVDGARNKWVAALLDPFGMVPFGEGVKYWTIPQQNARTLTVEPMLWWNRALWLAVAVLVLFFAWAAFRFSHAAPEPRPRGRAREEPGRAAAIRVPRVEPRFGAATHALQLLVFARRGFRQVGMTPSFWVLVALCLAMAATSSTQVGEAYGTTTYPVTYQVLDLVQGSFGLLLFLVITFYAGELVWKERELRENRIVDAMPVPGWAVYGGKLLAVAALVAVILAGGMLCGMAIQAQRGYFRFEPGLYLFGLFGRFLSDLLLLCVLSLLVHALVNHRWVGHVVMVLVFTGMTLLPLAGLEHSLLVYASGGEATYSDMNGWGHSLAPWLWFRAYWFSVAALLAIASTLFWVRGEETGGRWRLRLARLRATRPVRAAAAAAGLLALSTGGFIFYNTTVLNEYVSSDEAEKWAAEYERRYARYRAVPQPRVVGVRLEVDIFPETRAVAARGEYRLLNRSGVPIDSVHVDLPYTLEIRRLDFDRPAARVVEDRRLGYHVFRLARPLLPGDSLRLRFHLALVPRGFEHSVPNGPVVGNGTFFDSDLLPTVGYRGSGELDDDDARRRHGLPRRAEKAPPTDERARRNNFVSRDADWIDFEATVSTSADQVAVAPGYLQREWRRGGRRYFRYRMDAPILNFYAFLSGRYVVRRDRWRGPDGRVVAIEVYHHPGHAYNVDRMVYAVRRSLDYYTRHFGPYQHRQLRILEFPRYAEFAQSFANTIPYSEGIGFIADVGAEDIDYPFYVTAHEVAHQWWGHQVVGADVQGAAMLSETLSEYSALMVMEEEYGRGTMERFLSYELEGYLKGRTEERRKELPLVLAHDQQYVHYRKGALAMYALRDHLGEARLNGALRGFLEAVKFQEPPYTTSLELLRHLRAATPDSLRPVLTDLFETVTLYDVGATRATSTALPGGRYAVELEVVPRKVRVDSAGAETPVAVDDWMDVGVFGAGDAPLYLRKHRVTGGTGTVRVEVAGRPLRAGIDPHHKLIDRDLSDNVVAVVPAGGR